MAVELNQTIVCKVADVAALLLENDNYVLCPHINPDPDSIGSSVGLYLALAKMGKQVVMYLPEETPPYMDYLLQHANVQLEQPQDPDAKMIFLDLGTPKQLHPNVKLLNPWLDIDHHLGPIAFTQYALIQEFSPATAEIVLNIIRHMGCPLDPLIATCLYSALMFDTRNLTSGMTTSDTYHVCADLVASGADPEHTNRMLNQQKPLNLMKLMGEVFADISASLDDSLVWAVVTQDMLKRYQIDETECDSIITDLLTIATADIIILFKETHNGQIKVSWRSKCELDVNQIARLFGGGGHRFSCATRLDLPLYQAVQKVIAQTRRAMSSELAMV